MRWDFRDVVAPGRVKPSSLLGQHNAEVLGGWLGIGAAEVGASRAEGIV